jgi:hypothetical protein
MNQLQARFRRTLFAIVALVGTAAAVPTYLHADCFREYRVITTTVTDSQGNILSMTVRWEYVGSYCEGGNLGGN